MTSCKHVPDYAQADPPLAGVDVAAVQKRANAGRPAGAWMIAGTRIPCIKCGAWLVNTLDPDQKRRAGKPLNV